MTQCLTNDSTDESDAVGQDVVAVVLGQCLDGTVLYTSTDEEQD